MVNAKSTLAPFRQGANHHTPIDPDPTPRGVDPKRFWSVVCRLRDNGYAGTVIEGEKSIQSAMGVGSRSQRLAYCQELERLGLATYDYGVHHQDKAVLDLAPEEVLRDWVLSNFPWERLTPTEQKVYEFLTDRVEWSEGQAKLSANLGVGIASVKRAIKGLGDKGLIESTTSGHGKDRSPKTLRAKVSVEGQSITSRVHPLDQSSYLSEEESRSEGSLRMAPPADTLAFSDTLALDCPFERCRLTAEHSGSHLVGLE